MRTRNKKISVIKAGLACFFFGCSAAAAGEPANLDDLRRELLEQDRRMYSESSPEGADGNKGYIYSGGSGEIVSGREVQVTPEETDRINVLYTKAREDFNASKFEEAKENLREIIEINPLHIPSKMLFQLILDQQTDIVKRDGQIHAKDAMLDVDRAYLPPIKKDKDVLPHEVKFPVKTEKQKKMEEKASQIIPEINFTDAHIRDVLKYLSDISGINVVVDEDIFPKTDTKQKRDAIPGRVDVGRSGVSESFDTGGSFGVISDRITISLINIPLIEALKYILSAKGLKYRIDEYAIIVSTPERLAAVEMETSYYHLSAGVGVFTEFVKRVREEGQSSGPMARGLRQESRITIKDVLEQSGVPFPPGSQVFLDKRTGTLIVRNTPQNLRLVEEVLRMLDITPFQVEIEARFIELTQQDTQSLGLEWMITGPLVFGKDHNMRWDSSTADPVFGQYPSPDQLRGMEGITRGLRFPSDVSGNPAADILSLSGVLTRPEFRMIVHALNQSGFANVLSAPKVTTLNNQQARIEIVREIIYPTEFELTPPTTNDEGTIVTDPIVAPLAWTTRNVGIILTVTPSVGADRKTINLSLQPEVSKFLEWKDYGVREVGRWNAIPIKQPIFFVQNINTNVVIHDGETVVLGGLIKEESVSTEDKIPLLGDLPVFGRLFRSNIETTKRTNLIIFVTANLLTPTGERVNR